MIRAFWLVLIDLWYFLFGPATPSAGAIVPEVGFATLSASAAPALLNSRSNQVLLEATPTATSITARPVVPVIAHTEALPILEAKTSSSANLRESVVTNKELMNESKESFLVSQLCYINESKPVPLFTAPQVDFDGAFTYLRYGQSVTVRGFIGAYAEVVSSAGAGYVHKDALTPHQEQVWPQFQSGKIYEASDATTMAVRQLINDTFLSNRLGLPLQAGEYILVRLLRDNHEIHWPAIRPRTAGLWYQILRGISGVRSGITPLTDTIMEWTSDDGLGRLAYVEAVFPDQTLRVSGVGLAVGGEYSELTFKPEVWREWRPVFITITT